MEIVERYETIMGSDSQRDGMYLELWERKPEGKVLLEAFYSDVDGSFSYVNYRDDVPPEVVAWFRQEEQKRLPPITEP